MFQRYNSTTKKLMTVAVYRSHSAGELNQLFSQLTMRMGQPVTDEQVHAYAQAVVKVKYVTYRYELDSLVRESRMHYAIWRCMGTEAVPRPYFSGLLGSRDYVLAMST